MSTPAPSRLGTRVVALVGDPRPASRNGRRPYGSPISETVW
ncbi:MAG: hypothetical protein JWR24_3471 [Actinoallomurus sp.]|nr:hypothetical protein [Actinoallomurus sp.]